MGEFTVEVTQEIADRARRWGACSVPAVGTPVDRLTFSQLVWVDEQDLLLPHEASRLTNPVDVVFGSLPIWARSGSGYGDGYGYGSGYGSGDGHGSGAGAG